MRRFAFLLNVKVKNLDLYACYNNSNLFLEIEIMFFSLHYRGFQ